MMRTILFFVLLGTNVLFAQSLPVVNQQENDTLSVEPKFKWFVNGMFDVSSVYLNSTAISDELNYISNGIFRIGGFAAYKDFNADLLLGADGFSAKVSYDIKPNLFVSAGTNFIQTVDNTEYERYAYYNNKKRFGYYTAGVGTSFKIGRLEFQLEGMVGRMHSKSDAFQFYDQQYPTNTIVRVVRTSKLKPTWAYGGRFEIASELKNRFYWSDSWTVFISVDGLGNKKADFSRQVEVSEWVESNVVYKESTAMFDYRLAFSRVVFGVRWRPNK